MKLLDIDGLQFLVNDGSPVDLEAVASDIMAVIGKFNLTPVEALQVAQSVLDAEQIEVDKYVSSLVTED